MQGGRTLPLVDCSLRFQNQWEDEESGLCYNLNRYYDPVSGQYLSTDPIGLEGGLRTHVYVHDPMQWVDPMGLQKCSSTNQSQGATGSTGNKRGPKTDPNAPHNKRIREIAADIKAKGGKILAGGGGKERAIRTPGGNKEIRRPDILYQDENGVTRAVNVGRTKADGISPVTREAKALNDLNSKAQIPTTFEPYIP